MLLTRSVNLHDVFLLHLCTVVNIYINYQFIILTTYEVICKFSWKHLESQNYKSNSLRPNENIWRHTPYSTLILIWFVVSLVLSHYLQQFWFIIHSTLKGFVCLFVFIKCDISSKVNDKYWVYYCAWPEWRLYRTFFLSWKSIKIVQSSMC